MLVKEINSQEFSQFSINHPQVSFWQNEGMAKRREYDGWKYVYLGFFEDDKLIGAGLFYKRKLILNKYTYESYGGPLIDYSKISEALEALKVYLENNNVYDCVINPNLVAYYHNIEEQTKVEANDFLKVKENIIASGFKEFDISKINSLFKWFYKKDLKPYDSLDDILNSFDRETRRLINNSQKLPITMEELDESNLYRVKDLIDMTADNKDFASRNLDYYKQLYKHFNEVHEVKMVAVTLNVSEYRKELLTEESELINKIEKDTEANTKRSLNRANQNKDVLNALLKKLEAIEDIKEEKVDLCGGVFFFIENEVTYLLGGSNSKYFAFNGPQYMQWQIFKEAHKRNIEAYDFYGTHGHFSGHPDQIGVYNFKKGFNGQLIENFGYFVYDGKGIINKVINFIKKIRG